MVGPTAVQSSAGLRRPWAATPRTAAMSWDRVERGADDAISILGYLDTAKCCVWCGYGCDSGNCQYLSFCTVKFD